ncbi:WD40 repeat domain-containing protein [Cryptosporangium phraense]|uniref:Anaphase-promoting complex subunit 4-like WD40 domain-containing protein n=1 Tax=Cryptosporangium phraense TaxID=2593070 RepID=A0A545AZN3_9ACTN|nr:WD40 repeat domain-containing protein [Cryptosporangium phraense]TQS46769.1 hypothetical protein FL583_00360 [Cryptosporangium phraense]
MGASSEYGLREWAAAHARTVGRSGSPADRPTAPSRPTLTARSRLLHTVSGHSAGIAGVAWARSAAGATVLVSSDIDGRTVISDGGSGRVRHTFGGAVRINMFANASLDLSDASSMVIVQATNGFNVVDVDDGSYRPLPGADRQATEGPGYLFRDPDGSVLFAYLDAVFTLRILDAESGSDRATVSMGYSYTGERTLSYVAVSEDGWIAVSTSDDRRVDVFHRSAPARRAALESDVDEASPSVAWFRDTDGRSRPAVGHRDGTIEVWDGPWSGAPEPTVVRTMRCVLPDGRGRRPTGDSARDDPPAVRGLRTVTLADGTALLVSADLGGTVRLWQPSTGDCLAALRVPDVGAGVRTVAATATDDGRLLVAFGPVASARPDVHVWEIETAWSPARDDGPGVFGAGTPTVAVAFEPADGPPTALVSADADGLVVRHPLDGPGRPEIVRTGGGRVAGLTPLGVRVPTTITLDDGKILCPGVQSVLLSTPIAAVGSVPRGGTVLAVRSADGRVSVLDMDTPAAVVVTVEPAAPPTGAGVLASAYPAHDLIAMEGAPSELMVYRNETLLVRTDAHSRRITALAFAETPDGLCLASAGEDGQIRLWDGEAFVVLRTLGSGAPVRALAWGPAGPGEWPVLVSGGDDGVVRCWDARDGREIARREQGVPITVLAVAPDREAGRNVVAVGGIDGVRLEHMSRRDDSPGPGPTLRVEPWPVALDDVPAGSGEAEHHPFLATRTPDGDVWVIGSQPPDIQIWSLASGRVVARTTIPHRSPFPLAGWAQWPGSPPEVLIVSGDGIVGWDPVSDRTREIREGDGGGTLGPYVDTAPGRMLASAEASRVLLVRDVASGESVVEAAARPATGWRAIPRYGRTTTGRSVVAYAGPGGGIAVVDAISGERVARLPGQGHNVVSIALHTDPRTGRLLVASANASRGYALWDVENAELLRSGEHAEGQEPLSVAWVDLPDGRLLLAAGYMGDDGHIRLWDPFTGALLHTIRTDFRILRALQAITVGDGRLALVAAGAGPAAVRVYVFPGLAPVAAVVEPVPRRLEDAVRGLCALGVGGLWPPLSWVDDLVTDLGQAPRTDHRAFGELRSLRWPASSRVGLAALLLAELSAPDRFTPPADIDAAALETALHTALSAPTAPGTPPPLPADRLRAAADRIDGRLVSLLRIVGPDAVSADPLLPLRLRDQAETLPDVAPDALGLAAALVTDTTSARPTSLGTVHRPGSAGVGRRGRPTALLPSQLAMPDDVFALRLVRGELLFRQHVADPELPPDPVVLVLDTGPGTFGPVEAVLRLVAHATVCTLLRAGVPGRLVTTDRPGLLSTLHRRPDLIQLWTRRALTDDGLPAALATARRAAEPHPVVVLTDWHRAADQPVTVSSATRLVTSHVPGDAPDGPTGDPFHVHVAPVPEPLVLADAVRTLLRRTSAPAMGGVR